MSARDELLALVLCGCTCKAECTCLDTMEAALAEVRAEGGIDLGQLIAARDATWLEAMRQEGLCWPPWDTAHKALANVRKRVGAAEPVEPDPFGPNAPETTMGPTEDDERAVSRSRRGQR